MIPEGQAQWIDTHRDRESFREWMRALHDVIILHSLAIHQGRDNMSQDQLRVSCDFRYQPMSHPIRSDSLVPHMNWLTWEEIYRDWEPTDPVKYYWQDWDLQIA